MFCPSCGLEDHQSNQFCRACGSDLRRVRQAVEAPDSITVSATSAREEIGHAIAAKIRETQSSSELSEVAEDVLPQIEKFLESPEVRRLRRMRTGVIISATGLGTAIGIAAVTAVMRDTEIIFLAALGVITFFIGLGFILNGFLLSVPKKTVEDRSTDAKRQMEYESVLQPADQLPSALAVEVFSSVTEHTTRHLEKEPRQR